MQYHALFITRYLSHITTYACLSQIEQCSGELNTFIIEPFIPHSQEDEYYVCIYSTKEGDTVYFYEEGGVDVGDVDSKAHKLDVVIGMYSV